RAYAQQDPLVAFRKEAHEMYTALLAQIRHDVVNQALRPIAFRMVAAPQPRRQLATNLDGGPARRRTVRRAKQAVGRNEPCPCGSGKKYKNCCMRKDPGNLQPAAVKQAGPARRPRRRRRRH
ncbi:MAG: hypothetical protein GQ526_01145, partial [Ardenticatenales bacterium]|nr:hypothetical protein [Ardenticatenales bacterium]